MLIFVLSQCKDKFSTNLTTSDKSVDGVLGTRTWGSRMEGTDESFELRWRPKSHSSSPNRSPVLHAENTHCWGKYHCKAGLQFYNFGLSWFTKYKNNSLSSLVKSSLVKLDTNWTVILPPTVSVLCFTVNEVLLKMYHLQPLFRLFSFHSNNFYLE